MTLGNTQPLATSTLLIQPLGYGLAINVTNHDTRVYDVVTWLTITFHIYIYHIDIII